MAVKMGAFEDVAKERGNEEKFLVSVRLRPLNDKEIATNDVSDWECINDNTIICKNDNFFVPGRSSRPTAHKFDRVFSPDCSTRQVYMEGVREVALSAVNGINSSILAYGQTSSGKTYTMSGIAEYTIADIYDYIEKHKDREYLLKFSAMEIYNESVRDLLSTDNSPLRLLEDPERGTFVENLTVATLRDWDHVRELLSVCEAQRQIGETSLNGTSSRSHQIIRLKIESSARDLSGNDNPSTLIAAVDFVDLAGSEQAFQSSATRSKEGSHINRSLLTLGAVIRKLSKGRNGHVPYKNSKLTRILQSSLGANARTAIICTMSPARCHAEQSRNTLLFASRAKEVSTNAQVNVIISDKALVKHMQRELARLERDLNSPRYSPRSTFAESKLSALLREKDLRIEKLEKEVKNLKLQRDAAKTEVDNLLKQISDEQRPQSREGLSRYPHLRIHKSPDNEHILQDHSRTCGTFQFSDECSASSFSDSYTELPGINMFPRNDISDKLQISTSQFSESESTHDMDEIDNKSNDTFEDGLKEVTNCYFYPGCFSEGNTESSPDMTFKELETEVQNGALPISREYVVSAIPMVKNHGASNSDPPAGTTEIEHKACKQGTSTKANISSDADMEVAADFQHDDLASESVETETEADSNRSSKSVKDVSLDPAEDVWPSEFKRLQREIVKLWDACNVSLLHRSHFFLLFKGDQGDSVYMEIELQRLSLLREKISHYNQTTRDGRILTLASSAKSLVRERQMLSSQMQKQLSGSKRESLFIDWGIALNAKNRRLQLANLLWSETDDMDHVARSADVVFKLAGPATREKNFKEIFGLNFAKWGSKKKCGLKDSLTSTL
ncbi:Kinesin-like protein KIN-7C [Heracleum sosnowskyi]|uniref:Kinesin-like protein KIN-7C n=1 Tax=Heracleum sosnowskyi TaxID=360622 RepID=A0AAD8M8E8_9APIA|nr:Kinesin-like protein KIN-7C [Heracleum sosnowskyi]